MGKGRRRRRMGNRIRLRVPLEVLEKKHAQYRAHGKPLRRMSLASQSDSTILNTYQWEWRGIYQYYQLADNVAWLTRLHWEMRGSLLHTLAAKYHSAISKMLKKYRSTTETEDGLRICLKVTQEREGKAPLIAIFGGIPLKRRKEAVLIDRMPTPIRYERKEVIRRLIRGQCELCHRQDDCLIHQIQKLTVLEHMGKEKPFWAQIMLERRRKTLIVCQDCHTAIHRK